MLLEFVTPKQEPLAAHPMQISGFTEHEGQTLLLWPNGSATPICGEFAMIVSEWREALGWFTTRPVGR